MGELPTSRQHAATEQPEALPLAYRRCRDLTRAHGTTYYWAAQLLPVVARHRVHAVYAFCRMADDIVDDVAASTVAQRRAALLAFGDTFREDLARGHSGHPVLAAVVDTAVACGIPPACFERFLASMAMDLDRTAYDSWQELLDYMDGSAAAIGEMMLPVLAPGEADRLRVPARALGNAFQLTNFLRDVGEDLDRGRVYLPQQDLHRFGADPHRREVDASWRELMRFELTRCRALYRRADAGIPALPGRSGSCVQTARVLYARILDQIEANDFDVFTRRARVPLPEKLATAGWLAVRRGRGRRR